MSHLNLLTLPQISHNGNFYCLSEPLEESSFERSVRDRLLLIRIFIEPFIFISLYQYFNRSAAAEKHKDQWANKPLLVQS